MSFLSIGWAKNLVSKIIGIGIEELPREPFELPSYVHALYRGVGINRNRYFDFADAIRLKEKIDADPRSIHPFAISTARSLVIPGVNPSTATE